MTYRTTAGNCLITAILKGSAGFLIIWLFMLGAVSCRQQQFPEVIGEVVENEEEAINRQLLAQVIADEIKFIVPKHELLQPFIREFRDGTVVDRVMIRKVQEKDTTEPMYYLVGLGMLNGSFHSMALELEMASDNSLYLSNKSRKHMCKATIGCDFCYFTFSGNRIVGCECSSRTSGSDCRYKLDEQNELLDKARFSSQR